MKKAMYIIWIIIMIACIILDTFLAAHNYNDGSFCKMWFAIFADTICFVTLCTDIHFLVMEIKGKK